MKPAEAKRQELMGLDLYTWERSPNQQTLQQLILCAPLKRIFDQRKRYDMEMLEIRALECRHTFITTKSPETVEKMAKILLSADYKLSRNQTVKDLELLEID